MVRRLGKGFSIVDLCTAMGDLNFSVQNTWGHDRFFSFPADLISASPDQFSFCYGDNAMSRILASGAGMIICSKELKGNAALPQDKVLVFVSQPRLAFVRILRKFFSNIPPEITLGKDVQIHESVVLGNDGAGWVRETDGRLVRFTSIGGLRIGDNVEICAGSVIQRGTLGDTVIGYNTKIGMIVMVGHNVQIGKSCVIGAHTSLSGGTTIGDDVWIAPGVVTIGYVNIGEGAFVGLGSVVTSDVRPGWVVYGVPAREIRKRTNEGNL